MNTFFVYLQKEGNTKIEPIRVNAKSMSLEGGKYIFHRNDDQSDNATFFMERMVSGIVFQKGE